MKNLIIACAGDFGKEALVLAKRMNEVKPQWNILGFIDDGVPVGTEVFLGYKVIGTIRDFMPGPDDRVAIGHSRPKVKEAIYGVLKEKGTQLATLIKPETVLPYDIEMGEGCIIGTAWLGIEVKLGNCVHIAGSMVGNTTIDDFSTTTGLANLAGATIGKGVFIGSHAVVLNGKKVGDYAQVTAGSIVFRNVKPGVTVFGNPAKEMKF